MSKNNESDADKGSSGTNQHEGKGSDEETATEDDLASASQAPPSNDAADSTKTVDGQQSMVPDHQQPGRANQEVKSQMMTPNFNQPKDAETKCDLSASERMLKSLLFPSLNSQPPENLEHPQQQEKSLQQGQNQLPHEQKKTEKSHNHENNTASAKSAQVDLQQSSLSSHVHFTVGPSDCFVKPLTLLPQALKVKEEEEPQRDTALPLHNILTLSSRSSVIDLQHAASSTNSTEPSATSNLDICDHLIDERDDDGSHTCIEVNGFMLLDPNESRTPRNNDHQDTDKNISFSAPGPLDGQQECDHSDGTSGYENHPLDTATSNEQNDSSVTSAATHHQLSCQYFDNDFYAYSINNAQAIVQQRTQTVRAGEHGDSEPEPVNLAILRSDSASAARLAGRAGPSPSAAGASERPPTSSSNAYSGRSLRIGVNLRCHVDVDEGALFNSFSNTGRMRQVVRADQLQLREELPSELYEQNDGSIPFESLTDGFSWGSELCDVCHVRPTLITLFNCHCSICGVCFSSRSPPSNVTTCPFCGLQVEFAYYR